MALHLPGWYIDPADPIRMRHWNGKGWGSARRRLPTWASGTSPLVVPVETVRTDDDHPPLEGPARRSFLTADVTSSAGRSTPTRTQGSAGARSHPAAGGSGATRYPSPRRSGEPAPTGGWPRRAPVLVACALVVVALLVLAGTVGIAKSPVISSQLSADLGYVHSANAACASAMGAVRIGEPQSSKQPATVAGPAAVDAANAALRALIARLGAIPAASTVTSQLQGWFDDWDRYAGDRSAQAAFLAAHPSPDAAVVARERTLAGATGLAATEADSFALGNSLGDCMLTDRLSTATRSFS